MEFLSSKCPKLQSITLEQPRDVETAARRLPEYDPLLNWQGSRAISVDPTVELALFANLTSLKILNITGDLHRAGTNLVHILLGLPGLRTLALSINVDTAETLCQESLGDAENCRSFFLRFCGSYAEAGGRPLQLEKLECGHSIILLDPGTYLAQLTDLSYLQEVHVSNERVFVIPNRGLSYGPIAWSLFTPLLCPRLRKIGTYAADQSFSSWLQGLEEGYIKQIRLEGSDITAPWGLYGHHKDKLRLDTTTLLRIQVDISIKNRSLNGIQALVLDLKIFSPEVALEYLLDHVEATDLHLLSINQVTQEMCARVRAAWKAPAEEGCVSEVARKFKKLNFLRVGDRAWRIWRTVKRGEKDDIRLEGLDRFEARAIEGLQF